MKNLDEQWPSIRNIGRNLAKRYTKSQDVAIEMDEIDQETYMVAFNQMACYDPKKGASAETWAYYALRRHFRKKYAASSDICLDIAINPEHEQEVRGLLGEEGRKTLSRETLAQLNFFLDSRGYQVIITKPTLQFVNKNGGLFIRATTFHVYQEMMVEPENTVFVDITDETMCEKEGSTELRILMEYGLSLLDVKKQRIIRLLYGLGCPQKTTEEVAFSEGISTKRIRQIEQETLQQLRIFVARGL